MKKVFIERRTNILRIAVTDNDRLVECLIEEDNNEPQPGEIYRGVVKNIVHGLKCAFIDIGTEKNCYMYMDKKYNNMNIKKNQEIVVEVLKEGTGEKGPKVTNAISIPGRYAVLETLNKDISFSKNFHNDDLKSVIRKGINKPEDIGLIIRTNAENVSLDDINKEIGMLHEKYIGIIRNNQYLIGTKLLYKGEGILDKILRDILDEDAKQILVDSEKDYIYLENFLRSASDLKCTLELYNDSRAMFSHFGIEKHILALRDHQVELESGGYIVIDKTEAMYVIDVNSGRNIKNNSMSHTIFNTNMEAAKEIARQIKLRNLGGIIIIDFIDMDNINSKERVFQALKSGLEGDKNKTVIYPFTELNLVQIARRRRGRSIEEYIEEECETCKGRGKRIRLWYLTALIKNEIIKLNKELGAENIYIELGNTYNKDIMNDLMKFIKEIEGCDKKIYVKFVERTDTLKVEALIFPNHIENMQKFKIYG